MYRKLTQLSLVLMFCMTYLSAYSQYNYSEALQKTMFFYEMQRSGKLPSDNRINWRGDSHVDDGKTVGVDLTGGWYDAGDTPKWNVTMAFTGSTMAWSANMYEAGYKNAGQMPYLKSNLKWVCDYFLKCFKYTDINDPATYTIYLEVGDADKEHVYWAADEVMHLLYPTRPVWKADKDAPATNVVAAMAATLSSSSLLFRKEGMTSYADSLLNAAEHMNTFANKYKAYTKKDASNKIVWVSYWENDYKDQLCWSSIWLHRAKKAANASFDNRYLDSAKIWGEKMYFLDSAKAFWANGYMLPSLIELSKLVPSNTDYPTRVELALDSLLLAPKTAGGMAQLYNEWGCLRHTNNAAFTCFAYADGLTDAVKKAKYTDWAKGQLDYALGSNPANRSYLVGFQPAGKSNFLNAHHRSAHGPYAGTNHYNNFANNYDYRPANKHVAYGLLVGGPKWNEVFDVNSTSPDITEGALDYNAGITGNLARMSSLDASLKPLANFPIIETVEREYLVEAHLDAITSNSVTITGYASIRTLWPPRPVTNLSYRYYFTQEAGTTVTASIVKTELNIPATITQPTLVCDNIYYVEVSIANQTLFPGGMYQSGANYYGYFRKYVQFKLTSSGTYTHLNDYSSKGIEKTTTTPWQAPVDNILPFQGAKLLSGIEPSCPLALGDAFRAFNSFVLSPNPLAAGEALQVAHPFEGSVSYKIIDMTGRTINNGNLETNQVNTNQLKQGVYLLQLTQGETTVSKKFSIE